MMRKVVFLTGGRDSYGLAESLRKSGYDCSVLEAGSARLEEFAGAWPDVVVADFNPASVVGRKTLLEFRREDPGLAVIVLAGSAEIAADAAIVAGAFECLVRPVAPGDLLASVERALEVARLSKVDMELAKRIVGGSPAGREMLALVRRVAPSRATALLSGESGTGKELVAQLLHRWSGRHACPFVAIDCRAFVAGALEGELFGHDGEEDDGADGAHAGCFERANGGTLLMDEIGEIGLDLQSRLLRVLQDGEVLRMGAMRPRKVDVRVLAATSRLLRDEVQAGRFREDLFFRLNVITLSLPPLRERLDDVLPLAEYFLARATAAAGRDMSLSAEARTELVKHRWPGNIRELENVISSAVGLACGAVITASDLHLDPDASAPSHPLREGSLQQSVDHATKLRIRTALDAAGGNRSRAARALSIDRTTLYRLMRRLGVRA